MLQTNLTVAGPAVGRDLSEVEAGFAGQIATAAWLGDMTHEAAIEAFVAYALACYPRNRIDSEFVRMALIAEYRRRRERLDLMS